MPDIRYEDEALLILEKPPGVLVHPIAGDPSPTLWHEVAAYYEQKGWRLQIHPVSRLDRYTSGLVLFAKFPEIQGQLIKQGIRKEYLALVTDPLPQAYGVIEAPIARKPGSIIERVIDPAGKPCKTEYWAVQQNKETGLTLVRCRLYTGRTHQIRVHLAGIGCPLWQDGLYGKVKGPQQRHGLHSCKLSFRHPWTGVWIEVISALPEDLRRQL